MTTINLKDFYPWYTHDEYLEVSEEVADELRANKLYEAAYAHCFCHGGKLLIFPGGKDFIQKSELVAEPCSVHLVDQQLFGHEDRSRQRVDTPLLPIDWLVPVSIHG